VSTWKALVVAVNGDADESDEHWTTRDIETALNRFESAHGLSTFV